MPDSFPFVPYSPIRPSAEEILDRGRAVYERFESRRSVRQFSTDPVPREAIELAIRAASTAPSGAHRQPWRFVVVSDAATKREIRIAVEQEERQSYEGGRMPSDWMEALRPIGTNWRKPYVETAPWLVVVFEQFYGLDERGGKRKNYYVK
jgi:nitroreductase